RRALERPSGSGRRAVLRGLALLLGGAPLVWWGWRAQVWRDGFGADYLTAVGERRDLVLEDGSQVEMNTDSALDVRYDAGQRLLRLYRGEIYLRTAADRREPPRPFLVRTEQGLMRALGTAFSVRREGAETVLAVYEGAVQVRPEGAASAADGRVIEAGQRVRFDRQRIGPVESASEAALAWRQGLLVADDMPLRQWAGELMRYGGESIECEPSLDALRVSGTFPIDDLPLALAMLAQTHGLRLVHQGRRVLIRR
ncbi:TPA: FecR family protein, partial [Pseudomonas aeruginosa]